MATNVEIYKSRKIGNGAYGAVYRAKLNELPCAAKILHPILLETNDPSGQKIVERFYQECELMRNITHPNIVQYLDVTMDPDSDLPVLLMELLDESLTNYFDRVQRPPPYHTQVNLSHDIALAIAHLHSKGIVHRDLSSNNVLLIAGSKAKVSDFGMSKLLNVSGNFSRHSLTQLPGTQAFMPPEAFFEPPNYSSMIDCFSVGPLIIQLITAKFPDPGPRFTMVADERSPVGTTQMPVLEENRRMNHIALIDPSHPLLPIARQCLEYRPDVRLTAQQLCRQVAQLKEQQVYIESKGLSDALPVREIHDLRVQIQSYKETIQSKNEEVDRLCVSLKDREEDSSKQVQEIENLKIQLQNRDDVIRAKNEVIQIKESVYREKVAEIGKLNQQLQGLQALELERVESNEIAASPVTELKNKESLKCTLGKIKWKRSSAPYRICRGDFVVNGDVAYFRGFKDSTICKYDSVDSSWCILSSCLHYGSSLAVLDGLLTTIGGYSTFCGTIEPFSDLYSFVDDRGAVKFPSMPTKRYNTSAVCYDDLLIVVGGEIYKDQFVPIVEVLQLSTRQWHTATDLPLLGKRVSAVISNNHLYVQSYSETKSQCRDNVLTCSFSSLLSSLTPVSFSTKLKSFFSSKPVSKISWKSIAPLPVRRSTLVNFRGYLLAVGGLDDDALSDCVLMYSTVEDTWTEVCRMSQACCDCLAVAFSDRQLAIVGGCNEDFNATSTVQLLDCFL